MKLRQKEFCHNCNQYVTFEFDDITEKQVIYCPICKHEHYRELDEGTIVNIRMEGQSLRVYECPPINISSMSFDSDIVSSIPLTTKEFKIIGHTEDGRPIIEKTKDNVGNISTEQTKRVSDRRWGRDPNQ